MPEKAVFYEEKNVCPRKSENTLFVCNISDDENEKNKKNSGEKGLFGKIIDFFKD